MALHFFIFAGSSSTFVASLYPVDFSVQLLSMYVDDGDVILHFAFFEVLIKLPWVVKHVQISVLWVLHIVFTRNNNHLNSSSEEDSAL